MFKGSMVALITPFDNGAVDEDSFSRLVDWQIDEGTEGLIPVGTTGESPTLSHEEHMRVVELCVKRTAGRVPVIAGTGSNSTREAIEFARHASAAGADAQLVVTPYYNKPTQAGLIDHYTALHDATDLPIVIYNIPPRSVIDMTVETMSKLAKLPHIAGVKDATANWTVRWRRAWPAVRISRFCPAKTRRRSPCWRNPATAASRSRPTSRRASWPRCTRPGAPAISTRRSGSTNC